MNAAVAFWIGGVTGALAALFFVGLRSPNKVLDWRVRILRIVDRLTRADCAGALVERTAGELAAIAQEMAE